MELQQALVGLIGRLQLLVLCLLPSEDALQVLALNALILLQRQHLWQDATPPQSLTPSRLPILCALLIFALHA